MDSDLNRDRSKYIGGADVAAILGVSPWKDGSPFLLYQKKIGAFVEEITPEKQQLFNRGHRWEPIVVEMLIDELRDQGHEVEIIGRNQFYNDPEYPFLAAEIDLELLVDGEEVNAEAKTVSPFAVKLWGDEGSDNVPIYYAAQVMHGLMIKPRRRCVVAALTGFDDRPRIHWIERDEETIAGIREREIEFWQRIQDRNPPDPETADDVKWLYQRDLGVTTEATNELANLCFDLKLLKQRMKDDEKHKEDLELKIKLAMGDAAALVDSIGKPLVTWKNNKDSKKTNWQAVSEELGASPLLIDKHTKTTPGARVFLLK